jgi:uncharacterized membrane protein
MAGYLESLDAGEGLERRRHRHWYDRLMLLSDGVFAIAITFLAAEIRAPVGWTGDWASLWSVLASQLDAYAMSFLVISVYWLAHRRFMAMIVTADAPITVLTLVMLGLVALLPAATRLISVYSPFPASRLVYAGLVVAIGVSLALIWSYAALMAKFVPAEVNLRHRWFFLILILFTPPFFLLLTLLVPQARPGEIPVMLATLFLIGWRMRLWTVRRLETPSPVPPAEGAEAGG